ncbi:MAG TPA: lipid-binding SYLF domain-containing protein [Pirellulales bacterium]|nr:lipid-binding SYLF domain-containing protein [Pirellulales bacterium]
MKHTRITPLTLKRAGVALAALTGLFGMQTAVRGQYAQPVPVTQPVVVAPQSSEAATVEAASQVLNEIMAAPARSIPRALLHDAQAIVIAPGLIKGGFIIGARYGHGVLVMRNEQGAWRAPSFITIAGGSIGWQAGIQSTDVILVFKTRQSVQGLLNGKFTLGVTASAAAGPVGRDASAATDVQLKAEVYSYSRSRGLFAGAALDGSVISMDNAATAAFYRGTGILWPDAPPGQPPALPPSANNLLATIAAYADQAPPAVPVAGVPVGAVPAGAVPPGAVPVGAAVGAGAAAAVVPGQSVPAAGPPAIATNTLPSDLADIRGRLASASQRLNSHVDSRWQSYLALPPELNSTTGQPNPAAVEAAVKRYQAVAGDTKYKVLSQRPEFQETYGLLKAYRDLQSVGSSPAALALPNPPG